MMKIIASFVVKVIWNWLIGLFQNASKPKANKLESNRTVTSIEVKFKKTRSQKAET